MTVASPSPFLFAAVLAASLGCAALAIAQQPAADVQLEIDLLEDRVDTFFRTLTDKSTGAERAIREIIGNSPLKDRNDDIKQLIDQSTSLDQRYGAYTGHEQASARNVGKDLIFLRYVYKGERFPVVWYFTFYRPGGNGMLKREWTLIGLRFDSKVEVLDR